MERDNSGPGSSREVFLMVVLCLFAAAPFLFVLMFFASGLLIFMIPLALLGGAMAAVHYFVWGRSLDREVAKEREEREESEAVLNEDWYFDERWPGRRL
jgi:flagellar basal body-associated protein FliL